MLLGMNATHLDDKGVIETCPHCGQKNRIQFSQLANSARCGHCKEALPALDAPIEIDEETAFESLTRTCRLPVLVDFWADWCGPCKMMAPEVKRVAAGSVGKLVIAKVNTEGLPILAQRFQINAVPSWFSSKRATKLHALKGPNLPCRFRDLWSKRCARLRPAEPGFKFQRSTKKEGGTYTGPPIGSA